MAEFEIKIDGRINVEAASAEEARKQAKRWAAAVNEWENLAQLDQERSIQTVIIEPTHMRPAA